MGDVTGGIGLFICVCGEVEIKGSTFFCFSATPFSQNEPHFLFFNNTGKVYL